jgi:hypothetical protein
LLYNDASEPKVSSGLKMVSAIQKIVANRPHLCIATQPVPRVAMAREWLGRLQHLVFRSWISFLSPMFWVLIFYIKLYPRFSWLFAMPTQYALRQSAPTCPLKKLVRQSPLGTTTDSPLEAQRKPRPTELLRFNFLFRRSHSADPRKGAEMEIAGVITDIPD